MRGVGYYRDARHERPSTPPADTSIAQRFRHLSESAASFVSPLLPSRSAEPAATVSGGGPNDVQPLSLAPSRFASIESQVGSREASMASKKEAETVTVFHDPQSQNVEAVLSAFAQPFVKPGEAEALNNKRKQEAANAAAAKAAAVAKPVAPPGARR